MKRAQNHAAGGREAGVSVVSGPWSVKMPHLWDGTQDPRLPRWWLVKAFAGCQRPLEALSIYLRLYNSLQRKTQNKIPERKTTKCCPNNKLFFTTILEIFKTCLDK